MHSTRKTRERFVLEQVRSRGVRNPLVLDAMASVPRETFVPSHLKELSYEDTPLAIGAKQTISQPYIVAFMIEAMNLRGGEKVLEVGCGSGYAAAVLAQIVADVFTIERIGQLAERAAQNLLECGIDNVHVRHSDGTQGWAEEAPFDAILVSAGAPEVPKTLLQQLTPGGHLVVPIGRDPRAQELVRITRIDEDEFEREDLADVRFVPLIGKEGWESEEKECQLVPPRVVRARPSVNISETSLIAQHAESFESLNDANLGRVVERIGDARIVLIGEATHGTHEFYALRARLTRQLIEEKSFDIVAVEADWPDAARIDHYVRQRDVQRSEWLAFARFPTWMWRNAETRDFVDWLHNYNSGRPYEARTAFRGLDLYSLYISVNSVLQYLSDVDPQLARIARERYGCLTPWEADPAAYGRAAIRDSYRSCEQDVAHMLVEMLSRRQELELRDGEAFFDASENARLVANAEHYYRIMYYGSRASWNLRDTHMYDVLRRTLEFHGPGSKAVVWAHNSHIGDASATEMGRRGEHNLGQLCRESPDWDSYSIGFGTNAGYVAAATNWDAPMQVMAVPPAHKQSYERLFHLTNTPGLILPLKSGPSEDLTNRLMKPRLERAIGVVYRPESELASHYFEATLPSQFDEYIWIDRTSAIQPLAVGELQGLPDTYPFGL